MNVIAGGRKGLFVYNNYDAHGRTRAESKTSVAGRPGSSFGLEAHGAPVLLVRSFSGGSCHVDEIHQPTIPTSRARSPPASKSASSRLGAARRGPGWPRAARRLIFRSFLSGASVPGATVSRNVASRTGTNLFSRSRHGITDTRLISISLGPSCTFHFCWWRGVLGPFATVLGEIRRAQQLVDFLGNQWA